MKITVLLENTRQKGSELSKAHGLAILLQKDQVNILFDTGGPEGSMIKNAAHLGIDLAQIDMVVISHGHQDHAGGLSQFMKLNHKAPVYLKKEVLNPYYSRRPEGEKHIGIDIETLLENSERLKFVDQTIKIAPGVFIVPDIEKIFPIPSSNRVLFTKKDNKLVKDNFKHELFLVIKDNEDMIIFSGCGHNGIKNIVSSAKKVFPDAKISTVIGGFHLQAGDRTFALVEKEEVEKLAYWLLSEGIEKVYTGHCTGKLGTDLMKPILGDKLKKIFTGMDITV
jgi:7,8-dihydropterin-6-yl-methyl-4-(beta-D-ribofuranosyl)aminobenzene 5'-phosphate synthase